MNALLEREPPYAWAIVANLLVLGLLYLYTVQWAPPRHAFGGGR